MSETLGTETASSAADDVVKRALTSHVALGRVMMLVNPMAGSVGSKAAGEAEEILSEYACESAVEELTGADFDGQIQAALDARPDVLFVLAGDGTAGTIASRAGPDGPLIAPLPGGTMNMLPKALYGTADWKAALRLALEDGTPQSVAGGEVSDGHVCQAFFCAAIMGSPALWAPAREAIREGKPGLAWAYARRALRRAFTGHLRFSLDGRRERKAQALVLITPLISKAMDEDIGLEAAEITTSDAAQALRMAAHAVTGDWRQDPSVTTRATQLVAMRARTRIPAVIDGEPTQLRHVAKVKFIKTAFMALAPMPQTSTDAA